MLCFRSLVLTAVFSTIFAALAAPTYSALVIPGQTTGLLDLSGRDTTGLGAGESNQNFTSPKTFNALSDFCLDDIAWSGGGYSGSFDLSFIATGSQGNVRRGGKGAFGTGSNALINVSQTITLGTLVASDFQGDLIGVSDLTYNALYVGNGGNTETPVINGVAGVSSGGGTTVAAMRNNVTPATSLFVEAQSGNVSINGVDVTFGAQVPSPPVVAPGQVHINDHFADANLGTNPDSGSGFTSATVDGNPWTESGSNASWTTAGSGGSRASLQSNDSFAANSNTPVRVEWTISDWSRENVDSGNGRFVLGIAANGAPGTNPFVDDVDGIWIGMNHEADAHSGAGVGGITFIDGSTHTALGDGWQWDDNGLDVFGASLIDLEGGSSREDRLGITMNAPDLTVGLEVDQDGWYLDFRSSDGSVAVPASQSGTFSEVGLTNDLYDAIVSVYMQGNANHSVSIDQITVQGVPEPATLTLAALGLIGLAAFYRRRKR